MARRKARFEYRQRVEAEMAARPPMQVAIWKVPFANALTRENLDRVAMRSE